MNDWQPISTAPKDGSQIIAFEPTCSFEGPRSAQQRIGVVYWHQPANKEKPGFWCSGVINKFRPTHWMPLPEPPK